MRKIVHLSDVHFGTADPVVTELVVSKINEISPVRALPRHLPDQDIA